MAGNSLTRSAMAAGICVAACLAGACQKDPSTAPVSKSAPVVKKAAPVKQGPSAEAMTAGMVQAAPQGKSQLAFDIKFELADRPKMGQAVDLNLALMPQTSGGPVSLQVSSANGFAPPEGAAFEIPEVQAGEVYRHTLKLTPRSEGVQLLGVTVTLKHEDITDSKTFTIPLIIDK